MTKSSTTKGLDLGAVVQHADSLFELSEYRRALKYYNQAVKEMETSRTSYDLNEIVALKERQAECLANIKEYATAVSILHPLNQKSLSISGLNTLANCLQTTQGVSRKAVPVFMEIVSEFRRQPFALEVLINIIDSVSVTEIRSIVGNAYSGEFSWMNKLIDALKFDADGKFSSALEVVTELTTLTMFPRNPFLQKTLAMLYYYIGDYDKAVTTFEDLRKLDQYFVDGFDHLAHVYRMKGKITALNMLGHDLLMANPNAAETWVTIGFYCELRGKADDALQHFNRACALDPRCRTAFLAKGYLLQSKGNHSEATIMHRCAKKLHRDYIVYKALITSYLELNDMANAITLAHESEKVFPSDPRCLCLIAEVLGRKNDEKNFELARKTFEKVLKQNNLQIEAIVGSTALLLRQKKLDEASKFVEAVMQRMRSDQLLLLLGNVRFAQNRLHDALSAYQEAIVQNPGNLEALKLLAKVDELITANAPAADEDGEVDDLFENDDDDDDNELDDDEGDLGEGPDGTFEAADDDGI